MAEEYYQNLAVTAIVTPAIRAIDEKTGVKLMGNYQELRMQLDDKYHKDSFCVVVSKIDDMDCDAFCKGSKEGRQDAQLQTQVMEIKLTSNRCDEKNKKLRSISRRVEALTRKCVSFKTRLDTANRAGRPPFTPLSPVFANLIFRQDAECKKTENQAEQTDRK